MNERVVMNMMRSMEFFPGMGLGKNQQGPPEFVEQKTPRLKHGLGYVGNGDSDEELNIWGQLEEEESWADEGNLRRIAKKPSVIMVRCHQFEVKARRTRP